VLWLIGIASIFGTFAWCLFLGLVLLWRSFRPQRGAILSE
jgi:hypothetical protein